MPKHQWGALPALGTFGSDTWKAMWGGILQPESPPPAFPLWGAVGAPRWPGSRFCWKPNIWHEA